MSGITVGTYDRILFLFVCLAGVALVATDACSGMHKVWRGYLIDRHCADAIKDDDHEESFISQHTRGCCLMCKSKGYSLYSDGQWLNLDLRGNQLANALLQRSKRERGIYVQASGAAKDNSTLCVTIVSEIAAPGEVLPNEE